MIFPARPFKLVLEITGIIILGSMISAFLGIVYYLDEKECGWGVFKG
jgi:hypothetical protein